MEDWKDFYGPVTLGDSGVPIPFIPPKISQDDEWSLVPSDTIICVRLEDRGES